ncbi:hypothetical protein [Paenibacillus sp. MBLB4367]|uniref:hypothetical protein n=1 Tax=Paenibacillus sp. MBLB4367 TaxID=3384767 RepID=UPI003907FBCA
MERKLTRFDYIFVFIVIFLLLCAFGSFFLGFGMGKGRAEAKYEAILAKQEEEAKGFTAYHQTYLVSFYHTVFLPYKDFQNKWFMRWNEIESQGGSVDPASIIKELGKLADEKYESMVTNTMPESSPLLKEAHEQYLKSLKLFAHAAKSFQSKANSVKGSVLAGEMEKDAAFADAKLFALQGQKLYYDAIVKWNESAGGELKAAELLKNAPLTIDEWNQLNLNLKNSYISSLLVTGKTFKPFNPQDLVYHVDQMIKSGQAKKMNAGSVQQTVDILVGTGAVRQGDFLGGKAKWYANETLPQLPFFSESK